MSLPGVAASPLLAFEMLLQGTGKVESRSLKQRVEPRHWVNVEEKPRDLQLEAE